MPIRAFNNNNLFSIDILYVIMVVYAKCKFGVASYSSMHLYESESHDTNIQIFFSIIIVCVFCSSIFLLPIQKNKYKYFNLLNIQLAIANTNTHTYVSSYS